MDPRPAVPIPSDPRPQPVDPFAGLDERLASLDGLSVADRVPVFAAVHSTLNDALALTTAGGDGAAQPPRPSGPAGGFRPGQGGR
ncbi:hypothetical protein D1871_06215 [Nakamurella silvestris]|nr:hypothetical protein D1871_06215 [Nakamurella silvestris]